MTALGKLRRRLFGIPSEQSVFSRPGFAREAWERFQPVAHSLVEGYHATLEDSRFEILAPRLDAVEPQLRGFAYEGVGLGLATVRKTVELMGGRVGVTSRLGQGSVFWMEL